MLPSLWSFGPSLGPTFWWLLQDRWLLCPWHCYPPAPAIPMRWWLLPVKSWDLIGWPWEVFSASFLEGIIHLMWGFPPWTEISSKTGRYSKAVRQPPSRLHLSSCAPLCHHPSHPLSWLITPTSCFWCLLPSPKPLHPLHLFSSFLKAAGKQLTPSGLSLSPLFHAVGYNMHLVTTDREGIGSAGASTEMPMWCWESCF